MKLKKLIINNFRGIGFAEIDLENFTTLVGPNNIGKSTILNAIHLVLDNKKPKLEDWPAQQASTEVMEIICEFGDLEVWEKRKSAISTLLHDDRLKVKMSAWWNGEQTDYSYEYSVYCVETQYPWSDMNFTKAKADNICKPIFKALGITKAGDFNDKQEELILHVTENLPELINSIEDWHVKKFANSLQQAVPHVMYVPASFKIEDELKATNNSPFSFLFTNKLFPKVKGDKSYSAYIKKATELQDKLKGKAENGEEIEGLGDALGEVSKTLNQILDFDSKVKLAVGDIDIEPLFMKAATFLIDDEIETSLQYQGSGVQRALAFAMLEANAEVESSVKDEQRTVVVLYEEPELYIHPHLMRRLKNTLQKRSESAKWQVICSTHSPFLINIADKPESLKLIKKDTGNLRSVHQVSSTIFESTEEYDEREILRAALDFHPTVCESLFAKRVVIVEGDTEVAVFSMISELSEKLGVDDSLDKDTTVISAGGKWTITALVKVLNALKIDYRVIHDTDRKGLTDEQLKDKAAIHPFKANEKIASVANEDSVFLVDDTFEHVLWDQVEGEEAKSTDKPYNSWKRVRDYIDGKVELTERCEATLKEIVTFAFSKQ
ncbi:ATP-dependent endonuclease [Photobacterium angustum]|uniref:AAA family ATPase n=1 Tax=Photobacterium angustum TaxID=661 RepID=UPI0005E120B6|nr:AAA family ATPase [Photobacterium angustum]KJG33719.1 ATPase [Photobacterium angustum]PSW95865.1 ATP-dependent endonuclease [Photobacterium angustum]PSX02247.1 ATP-dependent endonuclease [Photobacterium angustum]PSX38025.1 ATP-dependent endonuclease [Photobacterium angustum]